MNNRNNRNNRIDRAVNQLLLVAYWLNLSQQSDSNLDKGFSLGKAIESIVSIEAMVHDEISDNLQEILTTQPPIKDGEHDHRYI